MKSVIGELGGLNVIKVTKEELRRMIKNNRVDFCGVRCHRLYLKSHRQLMVQHVNSCRYESRRFEPNLFNH